MDRDERFYRKWTQIRAKGRAWRGQNTRYDNLTRPYEKQRKKNLP